jgi:hypothetical protein
MRTASWCSVVTPLLREGGCTHASRKKSRVVATSRLRILSPGNLPALSSLREWVKRDTHKLNLELDTSVALFNSVRAGRWLRGVELEGALDFVGDRARPLQILWQSRVERQTELS